MKSRKSIPMRNNRVLGIDPGYDRIGIAVADKNGLLFSECLITDRKQEHQERLLAIGLRVRAVIEKWHPQALAIEKLYFNQNTTTALKVSEARGVMLYEAAEKGLEVCEYSPQAIKIAVTSYGKADKAQVETMIHRLIKMPQGEKRLDDEMDAIALCITHLATAKGI